MSNDVPGHPRPDDRPPPDGHSFQQPGGLRSSNSDAYPSDTPLPSFPDHPYDAFGRGNPDENRAVIIPLSVGDALSWAWRAIMASPLIIMTGFGIWSLAGLGGGVHLHSAAQGGGLSLQGGGLSLIVVLFARVALAHVCLSIASGRRVTPTDFVSFPRLGPALLASLLYQLAVVVGTLACVIPGIIAAFLFFFAQFIVVEEDVSAVDAMRVSYRLLSTNAGELCPFALVGVLLQIVGLLTCIGWVVTEPLVSLMSVYAYKRVCYQNPATY